MDEIRTTRDNTLTKESRRAKAIVAILMHKSLGEAAVSMGMTTKTLQRWLKEVSFASDLAAAESELISFASRRLVTLASLAISTLEELMTSGQSDSVRRQSACDVLSYLIKLRELNDFGSRLEILEQKVGVNGNKQC